MTEPISAAASAITAVVTLAGKLLKSSSDEQSKHDLVDMVSLLMDAQTNTMAVKVENASLLDENRRLQQEIARLADWSHEVQRYSLMSPWVGASAYGLKESVANGEPAHYLCPNCFSQSKKAFLSAYEGAANAHGRQRGLACSICPTKISYSHGFVPAAKYAAG